MVDLKDKKIIYELDKNARQTIQQLSKKIALSQEATRYRLHKLTRDGVVASFIAYVNFVKLGYFGYCVYCRYSFVTDAKKQEIKEYLKKRDNVYWVAEYGGRFDLAFSILARNPIEFDAIMSDIINKYPNFLTNISFITKLEPHKYHRKYLKQDNPKQNNSKEDSYSLKDIERKILQILTKEARITAAEISQRINRPLSTVIYAIKKLEKEGVIEGYTIVLRPEKIGYQSYQINIAAQNLSDKKIKELLHYCEFHKNIIFAIKTLGDWNFELIYEVENPKKMQECIIDLRNNFQDIIKDIELLNLFEDYIKLDHYPFKES